MKHTARDLSYAAIIAALYTVMTYLQNAMFPGSATMAIQFRASEALCVLALFTPAAIPGLSLGCLLFNITSGASAVDFVVGTLASFLAAWGMWHSRKLTICKIPLPGLMMPAVSNGILVGAQLSVYVGGGFWFNAGCVAIGEIAVLMTLGLAMYGAVKARKLDRRLFGLN